MISRAENKRVIVAMSGGVDSSVSAALLKQKGFEPIGVTIKTWTSGECRDEKSKGCCSLRDIDDARAVARKIGIPYYVMDLSSDFKEKVIDYFVDEYFAGRTPNPCIECNRTIKFGILLDKARELGASAVATGHYARIGYDEGLKRYFIFEGLDLSKDQSYVLFGLDQDQLSKTLLPIGELQKKEVRALAEKLGLRVFDKPDSQEICFVKTSYTDFVRQAAPDRLPGKGPIKNKDGREVGLHEGSHEFTIGQRKRIRVTGTDPYFVTSVDPKQNTVVIGRETDLYSDRMIVNRLNWQLGPKKGKVLIKIRSRHDKTAGFISKLISDYEAEVTFEVPQKAVTPGQAAVIYDGPRILGGGWIDKTMKN
ncbi:MAG: tRNA 2-thiouridine(34) synthase MnmA [Omnitrophica bacterium RIFCSPHIGHO2_02_FULL_51_18]|nr:MAG: tRNA 2-thiouridine(34) synthase MnmA [Omnitrophica bacterium RIFCSPHIGHO2_02_FULL_51_18]